MRIDQPRLFGERELLAVGLFGGPSRLADRIETLLRQGRGYSTLVSGRRVLAGATLLAAFTAGVSLTPRWIAFGQERPGFEVASIKPGDPNVRGFGVGVRGNLFVATNATLKMLVAWSWGLRNHQISGGPDWLNSTRFSIEAKPVPRTEDELHLYVQTLLAQRFKFAAHRESRIEPIYELLAAKGGPRLKDARPDPTGRQGIFGTRRGEINVFAQPASALANFFSQQLGRSVIDKTGLTGKYDFRLTWTPGPGEDNPDIPPDALPPADLNGPSLFTALQEQLGLRLESSKGPVDVLVIDHAEKPDAN